LNDAAMLVLARMQQLRDPKHRDTKKDFVFFGAKRGSVLNAATPRKLLLDMGYAGIATQHGMRATFKTWALETDTGYSEDIVDSCLAHAQEELDAAYHRGSYLQKRRQLMALWASYLEGETVSLGGQVIALRA
jgi:integrase